MLFKRGVELGGHPSFCSLCYLNSTLHPKCPKHLQGASQMGWGEVPSLTKRKQPRHTPAWRPSEFHQLLSTWTSPTFRIPGFLECCPPAFPSKEVQFYYKICAHKSNLSPLERKIKSPEMFLWNHELQGWVISHLKDLTIQTSSPVIPPIPWSSGASPSPCTGCH